MFIKIKNIYSNNVILTNSNAIQSIIIAKMGDTHRIEYILNDKTAQRIVEIYSSKEERDQAFDSLLEKLNK